MNWKSYMFSQQGGALSQNDCLVFTVRFQAVSRYSHRDQTYVQNLYVKHASTGGDGKGRWRGVVWFQVKEWIIKSLGFLEEGKKQRKLKSWLSCCGERRVWSLGSGRDQTVQRWSFYSPKETFALSVTSGVFGLRLYCLRKWDHKLPFASRCIRLGETFLKRTDTHIHLLFINLQKLDRLVLR